MRQGLRNCIDVPHDLVVPEPHNLVSLRSQPLGALVVISPLFAVLGAINLDDKTPLLANEINDITSHGHLAAEFTIFETASAKVKPEALLGLGHGEAQLLRLGAIGSS
jgi:hypothetical protein